VTTQFLVRFDDICPTMNWRVWDQVEQILLDAGVKPLLGVVPDNCDPELRFAGAHPAFWEKVRGWQARGWSIGLHGFQHCYVTASSGIIGRNRYSEFAGLPESAQLRKLERALEIFRREDVRPEAWIAPAHSFDQVTVRLLARLGVNCISDGYSLFPYVCREGVLWIPQQLSKFRKMPFGTWTVCLQVNRWTALDIDRFRDEVAAFRQATVGLDEIRRSYRNRARTLSDQVFFNCFRTIRSLKA
jgi:predicted deacetylase